MNQNMKKPITILSIAAIAILTIGVAVAQRAELRANADRFSFGDGHPPAIAD